MEAFCESFRLLVFQRQEQLSWPLRLLDAHMLDINLWAIKMQLAKGRISDVTNLYLSRLVGQLNFDFAAL
jgi:hypothetical protein